MFYGKIDVRTFGLGFLLLISLVVSAACSKPATVNLPKDIFGVSLDMNRADAQKRLEEIAQFESEGRKSGQLWRLKDDARFKHIAVGYDRENKVRFVTALAEKETAKERVRFSDVGDLTTAQKEVIQTHHKYIWDVGASVDRPAHRILIYGSDPEFLTIFSISKKIGGKNEDDESEED